MKNIIICCDGTANQFGEENSNVVKLYSVIEKSPDQIAYYDPGVGTISEPAIKTSLGKRLSILWGLAFGRGLKRNVFEAYMYLMNNYEEGDRVYFFGFSRGAYTVRVICALIRMCGLLEKGCDNLLPYAYKIFSAKNFSLAARFKSTYSKECNIHFVGVWDTVSSYGFFGNWKSFPYTRKNPNIQFIRHAVSIDERRTFYRQNLFESEEDNDSIKQAWFAGVHSDVGGSYPEKESGLSKISLNWLAAEASEKGLKINMKKYQDIVLGNGQGYAKPDFNADVHHTEWYWFLAEVFPRKIFNIGKSKYQIVIPLFRRRFIEDGALIHRTVIEKINSPDYDPGNLPKTYVVEEEKYLC